jgi:hypothetical protein
LGNSPISDVPISLYIDAYVKERTLGNFDTLEDLHGGLGGYAHGFWWHHPLCRRIAFLLHITAWEFMAYALNVIIFAPIVAGHPSFWYADAVSTIQTMIRSNTRSLAMQVIHELLIQSPEFAAVGPHQFHVHVYGRVNVPADAASRAIVPLLHSVTRQLGIVAVQIPFPERALAFLNRALDAIQASQMDEHPVPTPTCQVVDGAPQDLSDDDVESPHILPAIPQVVASRAQVVASRALLDEDEILCDADYDSDRTDLVEEDLDGEDLDGDFWNVPGEYRRVPWNGDAQDALRHANQAHDEDLARDDEVWQQPVIHHDSPPAVSLPRVQSQEELDRMHHLGAAYFGAEDQPLQF